MDTLKFFSKAITFVGELNNVFSSKYPNIRLYYKLMKKTPIGNMNAISKHCELMCNYINNNQEAIKQKDVKGLNTTTITFNEKIFLNLTECIQNADKETRNIIFTHLQLLMYISKPSDELKELLINKKEEQKEEPKGENKFISNIINKIESQFNEQEFKDPLSAAMNMMQSGLFSEIVQNMNDGVKDGSLNPQELLGNVQGVLGELTGGSLDINSILSGNTSNLEIEGEDGKNVNIDMNQMFSMVGSMMGGMTQNNSSSSNPMSMLSTLLPALSSSSKPSIDELEEEMNNPK